MKKIILVFIMFFAGVFPSYGRVYGPFSVEKIYENFVYLKGAKALSLRTGKKYKVFLSSSKGRLTSLSQLLPAGVAQIHTASENEAVIKFSTPVSSSIFKGKRIYLTRGKMVLDKQRKKMETKVVTVLQVSNIFYTPDYQGETVEYNSVFSGIPPGIGINLKVGFNHFNYKEVEDIQVSPQSSVERSIRRNKDTFYFTILGGWDSDSLSLVFGPILGVQNGENRIGFDSILRFGGVDSSQFLLESFIVGDLWVFYGYSRIRIMQHHGVAFKLKFASYPDYENDVNASLLVGYSTIDAPLHIEAMIGLGMGGDTRRGLTTYIRVGRVFNLH